MALNLTPFQQQQILQMRGAPVIDKPGWGPPDMSQQIQQGLGSLYNSYRGAYQERQSSDARERLAAAQRSGYGPAAALGQPGGIYGSSGSDTLQPGSGPANPEGAARKIPTFAALPNKGVAESFQPLFDNKEQQYALPPGTLGSLAFIESKFDPNAKNPKSSAGGMFQFIDSTAKQYGLNDKFDVNQSTDAAARLASDNASILQKALGRQPTVGELYLAHQQGSGGALKLLTNPDARAADIVGAKAVRLNGGDPNMSGREFAGLWMNKADSVWQNLYGGRQQAQGAQGGQPAPAAVNPAGGPPQATPGSDQYVPAPEQVRDAQAILANPLSTAPMKQQATLIMNRAAQVTGATGTPPDPTQPSPQNPTPVTRSTQPLLPVPGVNQPMPEPVPPVAPMPGGPVDPNGVPVRGAPETPPSVIPSMAGGGGPPLPAAPPPDVQQTGAIPPQAAPPPPPPPAAVAPPPAQAPPPAAAPPPAGAPGGGVPQMAQRHRDMMADAILTRDPHLIAAVQKQVEQETGIDRKYTYTESGGQIYQLDPTGREPPRVVAGGGKPETKEAGGVIYERQPDGSWKAVAGANAAKAPTTIEGPNGRLQWDEANGKWKPIPETQTGGQGPMFPPTSVQGASLNHLIELGPEKGGLTRDQAATIGGGKEVRLADGTIVWMSPQGLVGRPPGQPASVIQPGQPVGQPATTAEQPATGGISEDVARETGLPKGYVPGSFTGGTIIGRPDPKGVPPPAELGSRIGYGNKFLEYDLPKIEEAMAEGVFSSPADVVKGHYVDSSRQASAFRGMKVGMEALIRNMTGAGMNKEEAREYASRYLPTYTDNPASIREKVGNLKLELIMTRDAVLSGRNVTLADLTGRVQRDQPQGPASTSPGGTPFRRVGG